MTVEEILQNAAVATRDDMAVLDGIEGFDTYEYESELREAVIELDDDEKWGHE